MTRLSAVSVLLIVVGCASASRSAGPKAGLGIMMGELTSHSVLVQVRLSTTDTLVPAHVEGASGANRDVPGAAGIVEFQLWKANGQKPVEVRTIEARAERDFIARGHVVQ